MLSEAQNGMNDYQNLKGTNKLHSCRKSQYVYTIFNNKNPV